MTLREFNDRGKWWNVCAAHVAFAVFGPGAIVVVPGGLILLGVLGVI